MKRLLLIMYILIYQYSYSADFMHDLGLGFWAKIRNINTGQPTSYGPHIHYMPRVNFRIKDYISISAASPLAIGARFHPTEGNFFQMQLPATFLMNFGHGAFKKEKHYSNVGGFFGTGFNYILSVSGAGRESDYGIISLAGLRFYTHHHSIGLNVQYTHDFRFKNNFVGTGLFYTFGYFE